MPTLHPMKLSNRLEKKRFIRNSFQTLFLRSLNVIAGGKYQRILSPHNTTFRGCGNEKTVMNMTD